VTTGSGGQRKKRASGDEPLARTDCLDAENKSVARGVEQFSF
jgi:hypothetical protein